MGSKRKQCTYCTVRVKKETNLQRRRRLQKARTKYREKRMREAEVQRAFNLEKLRLYVAGQGEENNPSFEAQCLSNLGAEAEKILKQIQTRQERQKPKGTQQRVLKVSDPAEKKKIRLEKKRAWYHRNINEGTPEEIEMKRRLRNMRKKELRAKETPAKRALRLEKDRIAAAIRRAEQKFRLHLAEQEKQIKDNETN